MGYPTTYRDAHAYILMQISLCQIKMEPETLDISVKAVCMVHRDVSRITGAICIQQRPTQIMPFTYT